LEPLERLKRPKKIQKDLKRKNPPIISFTLNKIPDNDFSDNSGEKGRKNPFHQKRWFLPRDKNFKED